MAKTSKGSEGNYFWLVQPLDPQNTSRPLTNLVGNCPEVLLNNYLIVTSLDSGPLQPSNQQLFNGWRRNGKLTTSPRISNPGEVPFGWFDEWYVFDKPTVPSEVEVFVNYGTFSLGDRYPAVTTMYIGSDKSAVDKMVQGALELQQRFWEQIETIEPLSYVANGNSFIFVTRDQRLYEKVIASYQVM